MTTHTNGNRKATSRQPEITQNLRAEQNTADRILRIDEVSKIVGISRSSIYNYMKEGSFPEKIRLGVRMVGWLESHVQTWITEHTPSRES
ncbi:Phage transcriptional regulator, AlpA [Acidithiobacillus ferrivorans]|jgi:prophage regulatory protein|uniref:Phage transcriptional regulator, AlpA n=3 Tax=Acidithiobacillus TaxID=119977 RepID=A0A060UKL2_9PROT|nr:MULTISPECIES: AlpA family transcriptional regulator [Acidithiobacillus]MBU2832282.1 AlpA family transcriptional regulator [Acidithiobacillus ferriphilus]AEM49146.1 phage transcriptional regulator, AlpA [Acidithiobacillus ferrivorans SS3]MBU2766094.1 AlpA family transcriptional regulator [Acidithiobacillus ferrivorans]MBU2813616.1 AlpA family transcriptional regulator [Acidithiobacillus ferruginosus]CDQ08911.1 Phage transcriptional regulator, AlpA [Acidithiobacillus ferrivorans]